MAESEPGILVFLVLRNNIVVSGSDRLKDVIQFVNNNIIVVSTFLSRSTGFERDVRLLYTRPIYFQDHTFNTDLMLIFFKLEVYF